MHCVGVGRGCDFGLNPSCEHAADDPYFCQGRYVLPSFYSVCNVFNAGLSMNSEHVLC